MLIIRDPTTLKFVLALQFPAQKKKKHVFEMPKQLLAAETIRGIGESAASLGSRCRLAAAGRLALPLQIKRKTERRRLSYSRSGSNEAAPRYQSISRSALRERL